MQTVDDIPDNDENIRLDPDRGEIGIWLKCVNSGLKGGKTAQYSVENADYVILAYRERT